MYNNTVKNVRDVFEIPPLLSCEFGKEVQEKFNNSKKAQCPPHLVIRILLTLNLCAVNQNHPFKYLVDDDDDDGIYTLETFSIVKNDKLQYN